MKQERRNAIANIEEYYRELYHPYVGLLPSARFGIYAFAKSCLNEGDHVIISPLTCKTVINALIMANVQPIFADISLLDGNIDVAALRPAALNKAKAIISTNLYGNPDSAYELRKIGKAHGLIFVEDCAHVIDSSVEKMRVGGIGDIAIFSFKKFFDEPGGILACRDVEMYQKIYDVVQAETASPAMTIEMWRSMKTFLRSTPPYWIYRNIRGEISRRMSSVEAMEAGRQTTDSIYQPGQEIDPRSTFVLNRSQPSTDCLVRIATILNHIDHFIAQRNEENNQLIDSCPLEFKSSHRSDKVCYMVVPFFSDKRDNIVSLLRSRGVPVWYLYNPPMHRLFEKFVRIDYPLDFDRIAQWSNSIVPLSGRFREQIGRAFNIHLGKTVTGQAIVEPYECDKKNH